jgi:ABC-2 type transport system permease protein
MLVIRAPLDEKGTANPQTVFLGPVMAGMMIFFVFFTGAATAQSIIYEDEEGTLARLFTTPTSRLLILGGKFVAVLVTLLLQALVLMLVSSFLFHIRWGAPLTAAVVTLGLVIAASGFGILLMSWVKTTRQAGPILGSVVTITGILGGLIPTGGPSQPSPLETLSLTMPQGWALRGWKLALSGAGFEEVIGPVAVLLGVGLAFFVIGGLIFRRRFA